MWSVSYLPRCTFGRDEALSALTVAEAVAWVAVDTAKYDQVWLHIRTWADEIGTDAATAVTAAAGNGAQRAAGR